MKDRWVVRVRRADGVEASWNIISAPWYVVAAWASRRAAHIDGTWEAEHA